MGFDVFGIRPENEQGIYFRNSIWWWPRLWDYCCFITPELLKEDHESGHVNDGYIIDGIKHKSLVRNLSAALKQRGNHNDWIKNSEKMYLRKREMMTILISVDAILTGKTLKNFYYLQKAIKALRYVRNNSREFFGK